MSNEYKQELVQYVKENRQKLQRLAKHSDSVVRSMALSLLKNGSSQGGEDEK